MTGARPAVLRVPPLVPYGAALVEWSAPGSARRRIERGARAPAGA
ncbi:MAG TPA: hypothetical protein VFL83_23425 [Anaeromyxobacter sp.]|nr:hypothetical protein [Anaeromyxobacter sp.]